jgi:hypothetical protein
MASEFVSWYLLALSNILLIPSEVELKEHKYGTI